MFGGPAPVQRWLHHTRSEHALEAADLLHHEFVEVVLRDREESEPLQQRRALVHGLVEHAPVEVQPAEFRVEVERWMARLRVVGNGLRRRGAREDRDAPYAVADLRAGRTGSGVGVAVRPRGVRRRGGIGGRAGLARRGPVHGGGAGWRRRRSAGGAPAPVLDPRPTGRLFRLGFRFGFRFGRHTALPVTLSRTICERRARIISPAPPVPLVSDASVAF